MIIKKLIIATFIIAMVIVPVYNSINNSASPLPLPIDTKTTPTPIPNKPFYETRILFTASECGFPVGIDPQLYVMPNGTIWAIANSRMRDDVQYVRKSYDNGNTWTPKEVWSLCYDNNLGAPYSFVVEGKRIWVGTYGSNDGYVNIHFYMMWSDDNGATWNWFKYFDGLHGDKYIVPYQKGIVTNSGDVLFSGEMSASSPKSLYSAAIIKRNHKTTGETFNDWHNITVVPSFYPVRTSECSVVQLMNNSLWIFMRNSNGEETPIKSGVWGAFSENEGETWGTPYELNKTLGTEDAKEAPVAASRYTTTKNSNKNRILIAWCNHSEEPGVRKKLTIAISYDEVKTFPYSRLIEDVGDIGLVEPRFLILPNKNVMFGYLKNNYQEFKVARFNVEWLTNGKDSMR